MSPPKSVNILSLSDIGCPLSVGEAIPLMQSLINNTPSQQRMIEYLKKIYNSQGHYNIGQAFLGKITKNYYYAFMCRHKDIIKSNKGCCFEIHRSKWTVF